MLNPQIVELYKIKEKETLEAMLLAQGLQISLTIGVSNGFDLMNSAINSIDKSQSVVDYGEKEILPRYIIINNEEYQNISASLEILMGANVPNHTELLAYISGEVIPLHSKIGLYNFDSVQFRIEEIRKKRVNSDVYLYKLVRD